MTMNDFPSHPTHLLNDQDDAAFAKYVVPSVDLMKRGCPCTYEVYDNRGNLVERTTNFNRALELARKFEAAR